PSHADGGHAHVTRPGHGERQPRRHGIGGGLRLRDHRPHRLQVDPLHQSRGPAATKPRIAPGAQHEHLVP
ncbi:MAG: hypothetical protein ACK55I_01835, partial [bacterium]